MTTPLNLSISSVVREVTYHDIDINYYSTLNPIFSVVTRARDHTSSTLIGGKGGFGPSSLPTTLEGPTQYVNARW